jgi:hypothetical protein
MNEQLQKEIFTRLDAIAAKLGVAAAHLWEVLIRQGYIEGLANIIVAIVLFFVVLVLGVKTSRVYQDHTFWLGSLISIAFTIWAITCLYDGIITLANPEYFALSKILQALK